VLLSARQPRNTSLRHDRESSGASCSNPIGAAHLHVHQQQQRSIDSLNQHSIQCAVPCTCEVRPLATMPLCVLLLLLMWCWPRSRYPVYHVPRGVPSHQARPRASCRVPRASLSPNAPRPQLPTTATAAMQRILAITPRVVGSALVWREGARRTASVRWVSTLRASSILQPEQQHRGGAPRTRALARDSDGRRRHHALMAATSSIMVVGLTGSLDDERPRHASNGGVPHSADDPGRTISGDKVREARAAPPSSSSSSAPSEQQQQRAAASSSSSPAAARTSTTPSTPSDTATPPSMATSFYELSAINNKGVEVPFSIYRGKIVLVRVCRANAHAHTREHQRLIDRPPYVPSIASSSPSSRLSTPPANAASRASMRACRRCTTSTATAASRFSPSLGTYHNGHHQAPSPSSLTPSLPHSLTLLVDRQQPIRRPRAWIERGDRRVLHSLQGDLPDLRQGRCQRRQHASGLCLPQGAQDSAVCSRESEQTSERVLNLDTRY